MRDRKILSHASNGAPVAEPETWDPTIPAFNPHLGHTPEPEPVQLSPELAERVAGGSFNVDEYLAEERAKDLLRFSTAGSVDDGKSTLIGRLLYDTQSVYDDQIQSIRGKGTTAPGVLDLALLTDGLRAEREQGITIDVAYRYFSTSRRKFIIADTPGHEQYTRNMATGASTADVAVVLVDARKGVLTQSRRHAFITALLGVRQVVVAVNKMDLVVWDEAVFDGIVRDFSAFFDNVRFGPEDGAGAELTFVPVSALVGDNVVHRSGAMPWYRGPSLLEVLEAVPSAAETRFTPLRLPVQRVVRPNLDFRGFAGQIASGTVRPGDAITVLPSGRSSRVRSIVTFDGELPEAHAPLSVTLTLEDELDISRGDLLVSLSAPATVARRFTASLVWMDAAPLELGRRYLLKHTSRTVPAQVTAIRHLVDVNTLEEHAADTLRINGIALVEIEARQPLTLDPYAANRQTGSFVLIEAESNATAAAGMVREVLAESAEPPPSRRSDALTPDERAARWGHAAGQVNLRSSDVVAFAVERALFDVGAHVVLATDTLPPEAIAALLGSGVLLLQHTRRDEDEEEPPVARFGASADEIPLGTEAPAYVLLEQLRQRGILSHVPQGDRR